MKRIRATIVMAMIMVIALIQTSCIGSFKLTNNLYDWNNQVGDKFVNELVFLGLNIIPVYSVTLFVDGIVLNSIEFWSGSNPVTMKEGEKETKIVRQDNVKYQVTASKNRFDFIQLQGPQKGTAGALVYNPDKKSWNYEGENQSFKLVEVADNGTANVFLPNGEIVNVEANQYGLALIKSIANSNVLMAQK